MKIIDTELLDDSPFITLEICCSEMLSCFQEGQFTFRCWDFRFKGISIQFCPFCGQKIEYVQMGELGS